MFTRNWQFTHMWQPNGNSTQILLFIDDILIVYQAFGVNLSFNRCGVFVVGRACISVRYCISITCIRTYSTIQLHKLSNPLFFLGRIVPVVIKLQPKFVT